LDFLCSPSFKHGLIRSQIVEACIEANESGMVVLVEVKAAVVKVLEAGMVVEYLVLFLVNASLNSQTLP